MTDLETSSQTHRFAGWDSVAEILRCKSREDDDKAWSLNDGQRRSLRALANRLPQHGVLIADEVGMGKTRIAVALARSVAEAGGRVAILIPPGLGFQWQKELRDGGVSGVDFLRSLHAFTTAPGCDPQNDTRPWFRRDIVLVSHGLMNWRLGEGSKTWRWALLPALHARLLGDEGLERRLMAHGEGQEWNWERDLLRDTLARASDIAACLDHPDTPEELSARKRDILERATIGDMLEPENYSKWGKFRLALQQALGLGLGAFDLIITDEAHKSRGETSGLSTLLEQVIVKTRDRRRVSMTATPVELDQDQWRQALERIGVDSDTMRARDGRDIFTSYLDVSQRLRDMPLNPKARADYADLASQFQNHLSPYILRRDKREVPEIKAFKQVGHPSAQDYRAFGKIEVEPLHLSPGWKHAICAAEALSIATRQAEDSVAKRLRLTMGNGHGIAALLDQSVSDKDADKEQSAADGDIAATPKGSDLKRHQRIDWWKQMIGQGFRGGSDPLYQHPAIAAAIDAIEAITAQGRKVLVFGRFTLPMQALVRMLNARAMLRALDAGKPWPQEIIHKDDRDAIEIAHQAIRNRPVDWLRLIEDVKTQYNDLENERRRRRNALTGDLRACLTDTRWMPVLEAFERAQKGHADAKGIAPVLLLDRALEAGGLEEGASAKNRRQAFIRLMETILHKEDDEDDQAQISDDTAQAWWNEAHAYLTEEFSQMRGSFARLMYGGTRQQTRRLLQLSFNRPQSFPKVLVAQSVVGREGLNLHEACRDVVLLHPEWNPGVVEQQIGRVDRVGSQWARDMNKFLEHHQAGGKNLPPQISVLSVIFRGTYDEINWMTLEKRWDALRATLHGIIISDAQAQRSGLSLTDIKEINSLAPNFSPEDTLST